MILCDCCTPILGGRPSQPRQTPAIAWWRTRNGATARLCQPCLNSWFDNADDDPDLEPAVWCWIRP